MTSDAFIGRIVDHCRVLGLPERGIAYVREVAMSGPSRSVQSRRGNVTVRFASRKMGQTISAESHSVELTFIWLQEWRNETRWYFDQPVQIPLRYSRPDGKVVSILYTPDFLTIEADRVRLTECKPRDALVELAAKHPGRYVLDAAGNLGSPCAEAAAAELGIGFRVWSPSQSDQVFARNARFLTDFLRDDLPPVPNQIGGQVRDVVRQCPGVTIGELRRQLAVVNPDAVHTLIARGDLFVHLHRDPVAEPDGCPLFLDEPTALAHAALLDSIRPVDRTGEQVPLEVGAEVVWKDRRHQIARLDADQVTLLHEGETIVLRRADFDGLVRGGDVLWRGASAGRSLPADLREVLASSSARDLDTAQRRWWLIRNPQSPEALAVPRTTWRRWQRGIRAAELAGGSAFIGLLPRFSERGNHSPRFCEAVYEIADRLIDEHYLNLKQRNKRSVFGLIQRECGGRSLPKPSYQWVVERINRRETHTVVLARQGRRAAYRHTPQLHGSPNPNHADRPWEKMLVDHTQLDLFLLSEDTDEVLGRPWLTLAIDAFSRRVVGFALSFDAPSYRILMILVRRIVQRFGRMPEFLSVDGGKEFSSAYFQVLLARCECHSIKRPPAQARFGAIIERAFGTLNTTVLHELAGNSQIMKNVRQVTKAVRPEGQAVWTLESLDRLLTEFFFEVYDGKPHSELGMTPAQKYAQGMDLAGAREHRLITVDESFVLLTLPSTPKGTAKVIPQRGVLVHGIHYWADAMRSAKVENRQVAIRYDPFDVGFCFAQIEGKWTRCVSAYNQVFRGRTEKEIAVASEVCRQQARQAGRGLKVSAARLAEFLASRIEPEERVRKQRLKDLSLSRVQGAHCRSEGASGPLLGQEMPLNPAPSTPLAGETDPAVRFWPASASRTLEEL